MRENNKTFPVGGVDRGKHIDKISLKNAVETPFWMAVWAAEPERKISVEMSYSDLKIITDLIDDARLKRSRWIPVEERLPDKDMAIYATIEDHWGRREVIEADYINGDFVRDKKYSLSLIIKAWQPRYIPTPFIPQN